MKGTFRRNIVFLIILIFILSSSLVSYADLGDIFIDKRAEWEEERDGIAKITMEISGNELGKGIDVVLVLDRSGSMRDKERWTKTVAASKAFIDELYKPDGAVDSDNRIAMVTFSNGDDGIKKYRDEIGEEIFLGVSDSVNGSSARDYFFNQLHATNPEGGTNYDIAFEAAREMIEDRLDDSRPTYIVFMSDGIPERSSGIWGPYYDGVAIATALKDSGTKIYSLSIGLDAGGYMQFIEPLASSPKSTYAKAILDNSDLSSIFTDIAFSIKVSGTDAIVTDFINTDNFEITTKPNDTIWYETNHGTVTKDALDKVTWDIGDINQTLKTLTIYIKVKDTAPLGQLYTNFSAEVNYTDHKGEPANMEFPMPQLGLRGPIQIRSYNGVYDGEPHEITVNGTIAGDLVEYSTDGGSNWSEINPQFTNLIDHPVYVRVTNSNYGERTLGERLVITARPLEITAASDNKVSDGNPLTNNGYSITSGSLPPGQLLDKITITGSQTVVGSSANVPNNAVILDEDGNDVTVNYKITYVDGTLTVKEKTMPYVPEPKPESQTNPEPFITVTEEEIIDEEIPEALPELNKEDHFQYIQGYPDNTVRPEGLITREEVAAVFFRLLTDGYRDSIRTFDHNFPDVNINRWSVKHIATLAKGGIIKGYEDGSFRPGNFITRAELATIASRFDNLSPFEKNSFSDISGHWANKYINSASARGWVIGYPDGSFKPDQHITRAEFVTLVNNVLERRVNKEDILPDSRKFPDLKETKWYYEAMQESINSHHYERMADTYEDWIDIYYPKPEM